MRRWFKKCTLVPLWHCHRRMFLQLNYIYFAHNSYNQSFVSLTALDPGSCVWHMFLFYFIHLLLFHILWMLIYCSFVNFAPTIFLASINFQRTLISTKIIYNCNNSKTCNLNVSMKVIAKLFETLWWPTNAIMPSGNACIFNISCLNL